MQAKDLIVTGASRLLGKLKCLGDISTSGKVTATNGFEGNVVGNVSGSAGTAGEFTSAKSVTLTGDVTGTASSKGGWSIATTVKDDSHNHTAATLSGVALSTDVLTKTNTTSYTPSANYHPATKKYVDDAVSNVGGTPDWDEDDSTSSSYILNKPPIALGTGQLSIVEGYETTASGEGSHAEGQYTTASGDYSHAEGDGSTASESYSHAEGQYTTASGLQSHAEGEHTTASGNNSHAEGSYTTASGLQSHAEGYMTTAQRRSQHVFGEFNVLDTGGSSAFNKGTYIEIVGKGTKASARSNARTLDWSGNEVLAGKLTVGTGPTNNMDVATKQYVDNAVAPEVLVVTFTYSSGNDFTADKSYSDITTAYNAGKIVYGKTPEFSCIYSSGYFRSIGAETDEIGYRIFYYMSYVSGNTWTRGYLDATSPYLDLSGNRLQLKQGSATISYVDLPIYNGGVS